MKTMQNNKKETGIQSIKINNLPKSKVEIVGSITATYFSSFRKKALENINNEITVDGFRKGKIPENILVSKVGEMSILEEMAELALSKVYPEIIIEEKIDAIGRPEISITKIAKDNPLEFKIITTIIPEIKLGDYKNIAKSEMSKENKETEVTDKDVEDAINKIKESHEKENVDHGDHKHEYDTADFKDKIKKYLIEDKKIQGREKKRIAISDLLIETSSVDVPELLIESETRRIEAQFTDDITRMGVTVDDYLKHAKKTIEELRKDWHPHAIKKAKLQLVLNEIANKEKITVDQKEIEDEVSHIMKHYKDANKDAAYTYAESILQNEKVYQFLEGQK
jgi:FKBP-type peptidyl-prolyl cis-trans isomerase (trigger factor)